MNITINITPPNGHYELSEGGNGSFSVVKKKSKKSRFYKRPWFWLLIVFIVSIAVRALSKNEKKILTEISQEEDFTPIDDSDLNVDIAEKDFSDNQGDIDDYIDVFLEDELSEENIENNEIDEKTTQPPSDKNIFRFILNTATKRYHTKECGAVGKLADEKRGEADIEAESLENAKEIMESRGYTLCGLCDR